MASRRARARLCRTCSAPRFRARAACRARARGLAGIDNPAGCDDPARRPMIRLDSMTTDESRSSRLVEAARPQAHQGRWAPGSTRRTPAGGLALASTPLRPRRLPAGRARLRERAGVRDQLEWRPAATGQPAGDERAAVHGSVQHGGKDRGVVPLCASSLAAVGQDRLNPVPRSCRATADARRCPHIACISVAEPGCHRLHRIRNRDYRACRSVLGRRCGRCQGRRPGFRAARDYARYQRYMPVAKRR